jgi:hypothetical protein
VSEERAQTLLELLSASWQERNWAGCRDLCRTLEEVFERLIMESER